MKIRPSETAAIAALRPHPRNYRGHPEDQLEHLMQSIREHGFYRNVVVTKDGTILAGHGVVEAARKLGMVSIPVVRLDVDPESPLALKVLTGDNEVQHLGEVDDRRLADLLKEIHDSSAAAYAAVEELARDSGGDHAALLPGVGLKGTGYDPMMLAGLVHTTRPAREVRDFAAAAEWTGMPEFTPAKEYPTLSVRFLSEEDREAFIAFVGAKRVLRRGAGWSWWWPEKEAPDDLGSVKFE